MWIDASVIQRAECGSDFRETGGYADCWGYGQSGIRGEGPAQPRRREGGWSSSRKRDESRRECIGAGKEDCDEISASTQPIPPLGPTAPTTSRPQPPTLLAKFYAHSIVHAFPTTPAMSDPCHTYRIHACVITSQSASNPSTGCHPSSPLTKSNNFEKHRRPGVEKCWYGLPGSNFVPQR